MNRQLMLGLAVTVALLIGAYLTTRREYNAEVLRESPSATKAEHYAETASTPPSPVAMPSTAASPLGAVSSPASEADKPLAIDVAPGFEYLAPKTPLDDTDPRFVNVRRHQQLQAEPRDPAWSEQTETALRAAIESELTAKGLDTHRIELPVVECRTNACEIQAYGYTSTEMDFSEFQQLVFRALNGSVRNEFDPNTQILNVGMDDPGLTGSRATLLAQLPRKKP